MKVFLRTGQAGDGREKVLLDHVLQTAERDNPQSVLQAIDSYSRRTSWLMNIGDDRGHCGGLSSKVRVVEGKFDERLGTIKKFLKEMDAPFFEFVFLDHWKNRYMPDYLLLKEQGMIRKGSGIFADNMGFLFGPADFRKYVKTHPEELEIQEFKSNARWMPDSVTVSTYKLD
eukprot:PITA_35899